MLGPLSHSSARIDLSRPADLSVEEVTPTHRSTIMSAPSTMMSPQQLVEAAKAPIVAFNDKNWTAARACLTPDSVNDEVATGRKVQGADEVIALWQGWA